MSEQEYMDAIVSEMTRADARRVGSSGREVTDTPGLWDGGDLVAVSVDHVAMVGRLLDEFAEGLQTQERLMLGERLERVKLAREIVGEWIGEARQQQGGQQEQGIGL
jgi:hypothetical protein